MTQFIPSDLNSRLKKKLARGWPEVAFLLALGLSALALYSSYRVTKVERATKMHEVGVQVANAIDDRLASFVSAVISVRSFILARGIESFTKTEFTSYVEGLDLAAHYPGLRAIGFVAYRPTGGAGGRSSARLRQIEPASGEDRADEDDVDEGHDLSTNANRAAGLDLARDADAFTLTNRLDGATGPLSQPGSYEGYLPIYAPKQSLKTRDERRQALRGWVYVSFVAPEILDQIASDVAQVIGEMGFDVYDGDEPVRERLIYSVDDTVDQTYLRPLELLRKRVANQTWTVRIRPTLTTFNQARWPTTLFVALLGLSVSTWIYVQTRASRRFARTMQQSEGMLNLVINAIPAMISYVGQDERYVYANLGYQHITGIPCADIPGLHVRDLFGEEVYQHFRGPLGRGLSGERLAFEHRLLVKDGVPRVMAGEYIPHRNAAGEVAGVVILVNDVTEERNAQEKLRTVAQDNARLYTEAQAVNRVKDEFLATLSHELRTPLNVILGYGELLREEDMGEDARGFVETIHRNATMQNNLIGDLLDISAIITGKLTFKASSVNLSDILRGTLESVSFAAGAKGVHLKPRLADGPCHVVGDATRLQQIVWNLMTNAIKFTPAGGTVSLSLSTQADRCLIEVEDTGIGIDAEFLPYVFDRFRQEDSGRSRKFGGLGLGLSIVRHLVELHGGQIWVQSPGKDQGSRFTVSLPRPERALTYVAR